MSDRRMLIVATFLFVLGLSGICPAISITTDNSGTPGFQCSNCQGIQTFSGSIPPYVWSVPKDHFVGISAPMPSLLEARRSAIDDVKRQILNVMGANYKHSHADHLSGDAISGNVTRMVDDEFSSDSHGFLRQIENNIVDSHWLAEKSGNSVSFVLIRCSEDMIRDMLRLSRGAKVIGKLMAFDENRAIVKLTECHNVCVTFTKATVSITHLHKWANTVTLFFWRVEEKSKYEYEIPLSPLHICGQAQQIEMDLTNQVQPKILFISNSSIYLQIILHGFDEVGRTIKVLLTST